MANNKKNQKPVKEPNLAFVGKGKDGKTDVSKAFKQINSGSTKIHLPLPAAQAKPFYHPMADEIIAAMPHLYKKFTPKGEKK